MAKNAITFTAADLVKDFHMNVEVFITGMRFFKLRLWVASLLIKAAALIIGCGIDIKQVEK
jgi:hypothetical protein